MMGNSECVKTKLSACALGVAFGVTKGLCLLLLAWAGWLFGYGLSLTHEIEIFYHGYAPTLVGGLFGGLWGLIGGFIFGIVTGWIYNLCLCCCRKSNTQQL